MAAADSVNKQQRKSAAHSSAKRASTRRKEEESDVFTIDKIIDYREDAGEGPRWKIRWTNYTPADDTWEPAENIMTDDKKLNADMERLQKDFREKRKNGADSSSSPKSANRGARKSLKAGGQPAASLKKEEVKVRGKQRKSSGQSADSKMRVAHIRRYPDRDDDFQCVLVGGEGDSQILPVSEARNQYYNELIDYLLKRVKFLEPTNA